MIDLKIDKAKIQLDFESEIGCVRINETIVLFVIC